MIKQPIIEPFLPFWSVDVYPCYKIVNRKGRYIKAISAMGNDLTFLKAQTLTFSDKREAQQARDRVRKQLPKLLH